MAERRKYQNFSKEEKDKIRERVAELREKGLSFKTIGEELNIAESMAYKLRDKKPAQEQFFDVDDHAKHYFDHVKRSR